MNANTQITPINELSKQLAQKQTQLKSMLPEGMKVERFMRTVVNGIQMHPERDKLLSANRDSLFNACSKAAADGLMLDGREAALVVFGGQVSYMPMTQGLVKLARNSGDIGKIDAYIVYDKDDFSYRVGVDLIPNFNPDWKIAPSKRGQPVLAVCVIQLKDDDPVVRIMHAERIYQIAGGTRNSSQYNPEEGKHYEEWWKKTVIKAALKYAPRSTELDAALAADNEGYDFEAPQTPTGSTEAQQPKVVTTADINSDLDEPAPEAKAAPKKAAPKKAAPKKAAPLEGEVLDAEQGDDDII